jgi:hypothetical protein
LGDSLAESRHRNFSRITTGGAIYDEAKVNGATETQAQNAALLTGGFVGITSVVGYGKTLETLNSGAGGKVWREIFAEAVKDGARNAVAAGGQTIFENGVAKQTYDPNRSYIENVRERIMTLENGKYMKNEINDSEYSKIILERERKEKLWLSAFCVAAA